jgi:methylmalonyl-CoA/ethylmalonyl-CoA epimerase
MHWLAASPIEGPATLHHVAIVVQELDAAVRKYEVLGFRPESRSNIPTQGVDVVTMKAGSGWLELISPTDPESPISRFLISRGEGLHHVAYQVLALERWLERLDAAGVRLIDREPREGAHGWRIAFIHPESCAGVLTELVEE